MGTSSSEVGKPLDTVYKDVNTNSAAVKFENNRTQESKISEAVTDNVTIFQKPLTLSQFINEKRVTSTPTKKAND